MSAIPEDMRKKLLAAMDAPMTDIEAVQTVVAMFEVMAERIKVVEPPEQLVILPLIIRAGEVIEHLQQRLEIAA